MLTPEARALLQISTPFAAFYGACIGSFLSVCIWRIPRGESIAFPRSHCPSCNHLIPWYWNIPVFSWLLLRGKCHWCGSKISGRYILLELLTALLFTIVWIQAFTGLVMPLEQFNAWASPALANPPRPYWLGLTPLLDIKLVPVYWLVLWGLLLGTFVDLEHYIIPDRVTIGGMVAGIVLSTLLPSLHGESTWHLGLMRSAIGLAVGFGSLWLVAFLGSLAFKKEAMGFGDVKLLGAIGAFFGWKAVLFTILVSSFLGSFVGVGLILLKKRELQGRIPFGPFLSAAAMIWMFWGQSLVFAYLSHLVRP